MKAHQEMENVTHLLARELIYTMYEVTVTVIHAVSFFCLVASSGVT